MPTLGEACTRLRVSRRTLDKWIKRCEITPERHPADWRFFTISDDQVQQIRDARAQMPGMSLPALPTFTRQPLARPYPIPTDTPQAHPSDLALRRTYTGAGAFGLPDGLVSLADMCRLHNVPETTARRVYEKGELPRTTEGGPWKVRTAIIEYALNEEQQAAFLERFGRS